MATMNDSQSTLEVNLQRFRDNDLDYYDAKQDESDIVHYYRNIDLTSQNPKQLFQALKGLLTETHHTEIRYRRESDKHLKSLVDLHPDGTFRSLYSGKEADPLTVLKSDQAFMQQISMQELTSGIENYPLNIEHVVPQSYYGKQEPMRGDLHHLFYCEIPCNTHRGNKSYEDYPDYNPERTLQRDTIRHDCGKETGNDALAGGEFEPEYGKGLVARATLYFLLRHGDKLLSQYKTMFNVQVLLDWHNQHPPNLLYEKHRNQTIFRIQGNRNPLIDKPELAEQIDFSAFSKLH